MSQASLLTPGWKKLLLVVAPWTLPGLVDISQSYQLYSLLDKETSWWRIVIRGLCDWYLWAALSPLIFQHARAFRSDIKIGNDM